MLSPSAPEDVLLMDVPRKSKRRTRRLLRLLVAISAVLVAIGVTAGFAHMGTAPPTVDRSLLWIDTVERGEFRRFVRGVGTLVPEDEWWITAPSEGRVETVHREAGQHIQPGDTIVSLDNPVIERDARDAEWQLAAAEAELISQEASLESARLDREDALVTLRAELDVARRSADQDQEMYQRGILAKFARDTSRAKYIELRTRVELAEKRVENTRQAHEAQLAAQRATVQQLRSLRDLREQQLRDLQVSSHSPGVLQQILVEEGQQVQPGASLAKVARPDQLKAELRIAETQARDIQVGQPVVVDTRNGVVDGRVSRIDPAVVEGTVAVDVELVGDLPKGARPDLSIEGRIEIDHLEDVLYVDRPATAREDAVVELFRIEPDGATATRTRVRLGKPSVNAVEIVEGLQAGDRVILSDMSKWESVDRVRLR